MVFRDSGGLTFGMCFLQVESPEDILNAERLVFPGVGAFAAAMDFINQNGCVLSTLEHRFFFA